ncbi:hypothetical protein [Streptomyces sp. NPDC088785]|uniref:hypothetical protein n=1 Tax=Streptomyces sp. NPDC088785 TaxID=3365897 RepID=UPI003813053F
MADGMYIDGAGLTRLGKSFEAYAYDLESYAREFRSRTGSEQIHDGFGVLTESAEVTSAYIELAEGMAASFDGIRRHLDEIGAGLRDNAHNTASADGTLADLFHGGPGHTAEGGRAGGGR